MELNRDITDIIVFMLDNNTITLLNKSYRHLYFTRNGLVLKSIKDLHKKTDILKKYNIHLSMKHNNKHEFHGNRLKKTYINETDDKILGNIVSIEFGESIYLSKKTKEKLTSLKSLTFSYPSGYLDRIPEGVSLIIHVYASDVDDQLIELIRKYSTKLHMTMDYHPNPTHFEKIKENIISLNALIPLLDIHLPNLETLTIGSEELSQTSGNLPKLRLIIYTNIGQSIEDSSLEKYSKIDKKWDCIEWVNFYLEMKMEVYEKIRKYYLSAKYNDGSEYDVETLVIIEKLEEKYRELNPQADRVRLNIDESLYEEWKDEIKGGKLRQYFKIKLY